MCTFARRAVALSRARPLLLHRCHKLLRTLPRPMPQPAIRPPPPQHGRQLQRLLNLCQPRVRNLRHPLPLPLQARVGAAPPPRTDRVTAALRHSKDHFSPLPLLPRLRQLRVGRSRPQCLHRIRNGPNRDRPVRYQVSGRRRRMRFPRLDRSAHPLRSSGEVRFCQN
jgi:hypothetical protein